MGISSYFRRFRRWAACQSRIFWLFSLAFGLGAVVLISSFVFNKPCLSWTDRIALFVGLFAGALVWWQGYLITRQIVLGTVVDLYKEWNSADMLVKRKDAWTKEGPNPHTIEDVLEFLEKVSTFEKERFVSRKLIWDTFGWYMGRYYFYCKKAIEDQRFYWTPRGDPTLYQDLEGFYPILVELEVEQRNEKLKPGDESMTAAQIEQEYQQTRKKFIESETGEKIE